MRNKHFYICAAIAIACLAGTATAAEHTKDSLDTVKANLAKKKAVIIDVREPAEWKRGHLAAAQLVPLSQLKRLASDDAAKQKLEKSLPKDVIVYCHCGSGVRVLPAADILGKLGYDIRPLAAGFDDLREAGFPVAKPVPAGK
ncbi:MAG TPA: rhodanese-like domain-containing protein [Pirellulales bacterium]|nr:rhodanese-like domain-containing protein [Pirellulales bacterium]